MWNDCMNNQGAGNPSIFGGDAQQSSASKSVSTSSGTIHTKEKRVSSPVNTGFVADSASANPCVAIEDQLSFNCPAMRNAVLAYHSCATSGLYF